MPPGISLATALALGAALLIFALGLLAALLRWLRTPSHPRHALTPAPTSRLGVGLRLAREGLLFESLLRADPLAWVLGWSMHVALGAIVVQHLRYVLPGWPLWVERIAALGSIATGVAVVSLTGLWLRRVLIARVRFVSRPADHLWLAWLLVLVLTGAALKYLSPTSPVAVKAFVLGAAQAQLRPLPDSMLLVIHMWAALVLIALFPFSKLLHGLGVWLNPTRASRGISGQGARNDA